MPTKLTQQQAGLKHGFRSGLEDVVAQQIEEVTGQPASYETVVIPYTKPQRESKYTVDFKLPNGILVETKGRFVVVDRQKQLLVKAQHPRLDIRLVFSNSRSRISKTSTTTYGMWAEKHGFKYADKLIPLAWFKEPKHA